MTVGGITIVGGFTTMAGPFRSGSSFGLVLFFFLSDVDLVEGGLAVPGSAVGVGAGGVGVGAGAAGGVAGGVVGGGFAGGVVPSAPGAGLGFFGLSGACANAGRDAPRQRMMINDDMRVFIMRYTRLPTPLVTFNSKESENKLQQGAAAPWPFVPAS